MSEMLQIKTNLANRSNYGGQRSTNSIDYIVIHYTANDGDTDENNGKYFHNNYVGASAHYFVDGDSITRSVPDDFIAWHCGANIYKHPNCRNSNSIGIELCDERRNGVVYPTPETIAMALKLTEYLMGKYGVPKSNVIRHYDVTGKLCPAYWSGNAKNDGLWKSEFWNNLNGTGTEKVEQGETTPAKPETGNTSNSGALYRVQVGAFSLKKYAEAKCEAVKAAGFDAFVVKVNELWKVQVGAFRNRAYADDFVKQLKKAGFSAFVVNVTETVQIKVGSTVKVKRGSKTYNGDGLASYVYDRKHTVKSISGERVVITYDDIVVAAVHFDNLILA